MFQKDKDAERRKRGQRDNNNQLGK